MKKVPKSLRRVDYRTREGKNWRRAQLLENKIQAVVDAVHDLLDTARVITADMKGIKC